MENKKGIIVLIGALLFSTLFWKESLGLNVLIFNLYILISLVLMKKVQKEQVVVIVSMVGCLLTAIMVVVHNSAVSIVANFISLVVTIGLVHNAQIKSVFAAVFSGITNVVIIPKYFKTFNLKISNKHTPTIFRYLKLSLIPLIIATVFYVLFKSANPVFSDFSDTVLDALGHFLSHFREYISIGRILFFMGGVIIMNWVVFRPINKRIRLSEANKSEDIMRKRTTKMIYNLDGSIHRGSKIYSGKLLALKNENTTAILTMGMVGLLLLMVNIIDIVYVWFGAEYAPTNLSAEVHQGTYYLILSILLSMIVMLYFFRGNQNFYGKNKMMKIFSYVWVSQNILLVISVVIRNVHYIQHQGLTHKRIGVFIFLILTVVGLATLVMKIKDTKSAFFLMLKNSWAAYLMLIAMSFFNWDVMIVKYNMHNFSDEEIDYGYLMRLSDQAIMHIDILKEELPKETENIFDGYFVSSSQAFLEKRISRICEKDNGSHTIFSWSYGGAQVDKYFGSEE